jgi:hypothetical protein
MLFCAVLRSMWVVLGTAKVTGPCAVCTVWVCGCWK